MMWVCRECKGTACIIGVSKEIIEDLNEIRDPEKCPWEGSEVVFKPMWAGDHSNIYLPEGLGDASKEHLGGEPV